MAVVNNSCISLQAICASMQSLLGPNKSLKCYLSDAVGESGIVGDGMQVVEVLVTRIEHPIGQLLHSSCLAQHTAYGHGVTTLVCLASYWAREIQQLAEEGVPFPVIFSLFEEALQLCAESFDTAAISLEGVHSDCRDLQLGESNAGASEQSSPGGERSRSGGDELSCKPELHRSATDISSSVAVLLRGLAVKQRQPSQLRYATSLSQKTRALALSRHFSHEAATSNGGCTPTALKAEARVHQQTTAVPNCCALLQLLGCRLAHGRDFAMKLAVRASELQCQDQSYRHLHLDCRLVLHLCVTGVSAEDSEVIPGVVAPLEPEMVTVVQSLSKPLRMLVVCGDATPGHSHLGLKRDVQIVSHSLQQLFEKTSATQWLEQCASALEKHGVGLLAVGGVVSPLLWDYCLANGVVILRHLTHSQCGALCHMGGAAPVSYLALCSEKHVSGVVSLQLMEAGWRKRKTHHRVKGQDITPTYYCTVKLAVSTPSVCTAVLCGRSRDAVEHLKHQFLNCLSRLRCVFEDGHVLQGGGRVEAICVGELQKIANMFGSNISASQVAAHTMDTPHAEAIVSSGLVSRKGRATHLNTTQTPRAKYIEDSPAPSSFNLRFSWLAAMLDQHRARAYSSFANGLKHFMAVVLRNASPGLGLHEAYSTVEDMTRSSCTGGRSKVFDLKESKYESWTKAFHLAKLAFQTYTPN